MARPRNSDSEKTWTALLSAARERLSERGIDGMSLRPIAEAAGHRLGTLQYYFPTREQLIEAVLGEHYVLLCSRLRSYGEELAEGRALPEVAAEVAVEFYRVARVHPNVCRARMVTNLASGAMSAPSRAALSSAARRIEASCPARLDHTRLVLAMHSMNVLLLRYGAHSPGELMELLGESSEDAAVLAAEAHIADAARRLVEPAMSRRPQTKRSRPRAA